ncbi:hypothetical protein BH11ACT8_BH11ACT8_19190 [soil metagenome]
MTATRRWARRVLVAVVLALIAFVVTSFAQLDPRAVTLLPLVVVGVVGVGLLNDAVSGRGFAWFPAPVHPSLTRGRDSVSVAHARQIENHLTSRHPDAGVRDRLAALADEVLRMRHGERLDSPEGLARLGPDVGPLLTGRVRRLSLRTIDQCLRTIEEL